ncbi:hypothetical protein BDW75DRAFT_245786 [Aspergillus navahoensis]
MAYNRVACVALCLLLTSLSWVSIGVRYYVRYAMLRNLSYDDAFAAISLVFYTTAALLYTMAAKLVAVSQVVYFAATHFIKRLFILTLFQLVHGRVYIWLLYSLTRISTIITVISGFWLLFSCRPVEYLWKQTVQPGSGTCVTSTSLLITMLLQTSWILGVDITLGLVIPTLLISRLSMNPNTKISIFLLLGRLVID